MDEHDADRGQRVDSPISDHSNDIDDDHLTDSMQIVTVGDTTAVTSFDQFMTALFRKFMADDLQWQR